MAQRQRTVKAINFKPCPFCGAEIATLLKTEDYVEVECPGCNVVMREYCDEADEFVDGLRQKWNKRLMHSKLLHDNS